MNNSIRTNTKLAYLEDTFRFEGNGKILLTDKDDKGQFVVLDETIFYPQGGGQPSDIGTLEVESSEIFNITFVSLLNGIVKHYLKEINFPAELVGKNANLKIDSFRRLANAKSHTSGHLVASIVEKIAPELIAIKGYHFPEGPYVEFSGKLKNISSDDLIKKISEITKTKIDSGASISIKEEIVEIKDEKKIRLVQIEGFEAVPCGGTHLSCLSDLKNVIIRKIQFPKGNTKMSYTYN